MSCLTFNIFLDLFLCTLTLYFMNYRPRKHFAGKKIYIFRMFTVFPILCDTACIVLKILASNKAVIIPAAAYPLLTTKPPLTFAMFFVMMLFIKYRERSFLKHGKTHEEYREFLKTNTNSFQFSLFMAGIIVVFGVIDAIIYPVLILIHLRSSGITGSISSEQFNAAGHIVESWGFGGTVEMILLAPIMLLFSYTRSHKNPLIDTAIPIVSVICIVFVYIESALDIVRSLANQLKEFLNL